MGISSSNVPERDFHKPGSPTLPASADKRSPRSNVGPPTRVSTSSIVSSMPSVSPSIASSFFTAQGLWTTTSLRDVVLPDVKIPLTRSRHSTQSKRLPVDPGGSATLDDRGWDVRFKRAVVVDVQRWGLENPDFIPTLAELLEALRTNPYQFPEKHGDLAGARAAELTYRGRSLRRCRTPTTSVNS